jgi:hypothetical protein
MTRLWQRRTASRTLPGKVDPCRLPPTGEPRPATALVGGALAGSGPGTSPCIDGLSLSCYVARWRKAKALAPGVMEVMRRRLGRRDLNPPSRGLTSRGHRHQGAPTCGFFRPLMTARACRRPAVPMLCGPSTDRHEARARGGHGWPVASRVEAWSFEVRRPAESSPGRPLPWLTCLRPGDSVGRSMSRLKGASGWLSSPE